MGKGLSPERLDALNQLKEQMPTDLVPGYSIATSGPVDPESPWVKRMSKFSKDLSVNAYAYFNYDLRAKGGPKKRRRVPRRVISADGFPPWVTVSYAYPPPYSFMTPHKTRDVKHFVMHSFGHGWHAGMRKKPRKGWLNTPGRKGRGLEPTTFEGQPVFVPKGSDLDVSSGSDLATMEHFTRFSAGLRSCLSSAAQASAHFFIDRAGNLVVVGDCNDILWTSQGVSMTSVGVEMEEAFYVTEDTKGRKNAATWKPGGRPPGSEGTINYFAYSLQQMLTLSILIKKLESVYPRLKERNIFFKRRSFRKKDPAGYTMHDWIKGSHHMDISPHFLTQDLWDAFFNLVDAQTHITASNAFRRRTRYKQGKGEIKQTNPLSSQTLTAMTERLFNTAKETGVAKDRADNLTEVDRAAVNTNAGNNAVKESLKVSQQVANITQVSQQTQDPIQELPAVNLSIGADNQQVGSDDTWSIG